MARRTAPQPQKRPRRVTEKYPLRRPHVALWENVGELNFIIRQMAGHAFIKDRDLRFVYASEVFTKGHGLTPREIAGKTDYDLFPREEAERYRAEDRAVMEKGEIAFVEDPRWSAVKIPIKDARGDVTALVAWSTWTDYKQHVAERLFHFASVVISSADAIVGLSLDGVILSWNPGAEEMYGHTAGEMMGQPIAVLWDAEHQAELKERLDEVAAGATVRDYEMTHLCKDGSSVRVSVTFSPLVGVYGTVAGVSMVARDVTERVQMEDELKTALAQLVGAQSELSHSAYPRLQGDKPHREEMGRVAREIRRDPYRDLNFAAEARRIHMSYSHFRQVFRDCIGRPPHDYLLVWRMRRAAKELRDPRKPIKTVAREAGYEDPAQFSKLFKEKIGMSPRQYRDVVRKL